MNSKVSLILSTFLSHSSLERSVTRKSPTLRKSSWCWSSITGTSTLYLSCQSINKTPFSYSMDSFNAICYTRNILQYIPAFSWHLYMGKGTNDIYTHANIDLIKKFHMDAGDPYLLDEKCFNR